MSYFPYEIVISFKSRSYVYLIILTAPGTMTSTEYLFIDSFIHKHLDNDKNSQI